jgi:hypothetical protein
VAQVSRSGSVNIYSDVALASTGFVNLFTPTGSILTAAVSAGGTGYTVGDILLLDNGDNGLTGIGATVEVLTAPAGIVGSIRIVNGGSGYDSGLVSSSYFTIGGTGGGDCTILVQTITPVPPVEITVNSITVSMIANVAGVQSGAITLQEANVSTLWKTHCPPWTAIAAGEGRSQFYPINKTFSPSRILRVRYLAVLNATTAAINVVWSRGGG